MIGTRHHCRNAIIKATISCLDEWGYSATSINRITERAQVSRGALTHHFQSKEDLIVATADCLLEGGMRVSQRRKTQACGGDGARAAVKADLTWLWRTCLDTKQGRAFVEILSASRTDKVLKARIEQHLWRWNERIDARFVELYQSAGSDDRDVRLLMTICRVFFRGLLIHDQFVRDKEEHRAVVDRFIELVSPHLTPRY